MLCPKKPDNNFVEKGKRIHDIEVDEFVEDVWAKIFWYKTAEN